MKRSNIFTCTIFLLFFGVVIPRLQAEDADELSRLRNGYKSAVDRVVAPLENRYLSHLQKLQNKLTRQNNLDAAIQVREEIKLVEQKIESRKTGKLDTHPPKKPESETFSEFLQKSELFWEGRNGKITLQFDEKKVVVQANGIEIMEKDYTIIPPLMVEFQWSPGDLHTFTIDKKKRNFSRKMQTSGELLTGSISKRKDKSNSSK